MCVFQMSNDVKNEASSELQVYWFEMKQAVNYKFIGLKCIWLMYLINDYTADDDGKKSFKKTKSIKFLL